MYLLAHVAHFNPTWAVSVFPKNLGAPTRHSLATEAARPKSPWHLNFSKTPTPTTAVGDDRYMTNIAIEHDPFIADLPMQDCDFQ